MKSIRPLPAVLLATVFATGLVFLFSPSTRANRPQGRQFVDEVSRTFDLPMLADNFTVIESPLNAALRPRRVARGERRHVWADQALIIDVLTEGNSTRFEFARLSRRPKAPEGRQANSRIKSEVDAQTIGEHYARRVTSSQIFGGGSREWQVAHVYWDDSARPKLPNEVANGISMYLWVPTFEGLPVATGAGPRILLQLDGESGRPMSVLFSEAHFDGNEPTLTEAECRQRAQSYFDANVEFLPDGRISILEGELAWVAEEGFLSKSEGGAIRAVKGYHFRTSDPNIDVTIDGTSGRVTKDSALIYLKETARKP